MSISSVLAQQLDDTRAWTLRLLEDLSGEDWTFQPADGMAHPLWLCGHLACAQDLLVHRRVLGGSGIVDDAFAAHFPIGAPVKAAAEHAYPTPDDVKAKMGTVHAKTIEVVRGISDAVLAEPCMGGDGKPHPHYADKGGAIAHCARHEAFHAGQIASIRRLLGKSFLR